MIELTENYETSIQELKNEHDIILKKLSVELEQVTRSLNEKELENRIMKSNIENLTTNKNQ